MNAIYCRVSTDIQAEQGYSIGDQIRTCHAHAAKLGLEAVEYIDDGYSGEYLERPALDHLRDDLRAKLIQNVIIYDPDRLSRNLTNQLLLADEIEKAGAKLFFVTGDYDASPEGRLFFSIRGAISAFEKAKIRERTLRGKRSKALSGKIIQNGKAYGYNWDKENSIYIVNDEEAETVKIIYELYLSQRLTVKDIAILFRSKGIVNRQGKPFSISHIHRILSDEKYAGTKWSFKYYEKKISQYKTHKTKRDEKEWIRISIPPIVTEEQFRAAEKILDANRRRSPRNTKQEYLLRGFLKCGVCGYGLSSHYKLKPSGKEYRWYSCNSGTIDKALHPCGNPTIQCEKLDNFVWEIFCKYAKQKEGIYSLLSEESTDNSENSSKLIKYQDQLKKRQQTLTKWVRTGMIEPEDADKEIVSIAKELRQINESVAKLSVQKKEKQLKVTAKEILAAKSFQERRTIIEKLNWVFVVDNTGLETIVEFTLGTV
ncbi:MAG: recombinase family protein [Veillonellales bacterium]